MFMEPLPEYVDPRLLAEEKVELKGDIPLSRFARLANYLCNRCGGVQVKLQFHQGNHHTLVIIGQVQAMLSMQCQYCLDPVKVAVNKELNLTLVDSDESARATDEATEVVIVEGDRIELAAIVEDDLILSLPMVAKHGSGDCLGDLEYNPDEGAKDHPFAALEQLKQK